MLRSMAIRMKEWGLLAYPRQTVHLPLNSLNDWGRTGRALGQGVQEAGYGLVELVPAIARVAKAGQRADAAAMLREIGEETTEELLELPVRDWDYSWEQSFQPRVQQVLSQFSGEEREQARQMSETLGQRYSLEGRRRMELQRIRHARDQWQEQVDSAVRQGDEESACRWIEQGREIFVPESEMPRELNSVRNRSLQAAWQQQLQQEPYAALQAWQSADSRKPDDEALLQRLEGDMENARHHLYRNLARQLAVDVEQGREPDTAQLERAAAVGVLPAEQMRNRGTEIASLSVADTCNWLRRIDERESGDDEHLVVDIALAPIPLEQRRLLLQRVQSTGALPPHQRTAMSRTLWNWYREGRFGCPGDAESMLYLGRLQEEALLRMTTESSDAANSWLENLGKNADAWLCFDEQ